LLPISPEGYPKGAVNNNVSSEIGISTPLKESILPVNPLLNIREDPNFLWLNSLGEIVTEDHTHVPTGPHEESGVDDLFFQSESFRTPIHSTRIFNPSSGPSHSFQRTTRNMIFLIKYHSWHHKCP